MELITERDEIQSVADRWFDTYHEGNGRWKFAVVGDTCVIWGRLVRLDKERCSRQAVAAAIGNDSWIRNAQCVICDEIHSEYYWIGWRKNKWGENMGVYLCTLCAAKRKADE